MLMLVTVLMFIVSGYPTDFVRPELADFVGLLSEEAGVFEPWAYSLTPLLLVSASGETGQDLWGTGG